jgi:chlorophyll synthase
MWAFACGVVSSDVPLAGKWPVLALGVLLTGPLVCASSQAVNDWFDRHVDAINEPNRPIPSGRIPGMWGLYIAIIWSVLSLVAALPMGRYGVAATALALVLSWAYSMPPVRLKQNGWFGNLAVGLSYESLAWITGAAVMLGGTAPSAPILLLALLYGLGAHGIMTLNDFKAVEGDRAMGIRSLPARHGEPQAAWIAVVVMFAAQVGVLAMHAQWHTGWYMVALTALVLAQLPIMGRLVTAPTPRRALELSAFGVPFYVSGMMVTAAAVRSLHVSAR